MTKFIVENHVDRFRIIDFHVLIYVPPIRLSPEFENTLRDLFNSFAQMETWVDSYSLRVAGEQSNNGKVVDVVCDLKPSAIYDLPDVVQELLRSIINTASRRVFLDEELELRFAVKDSLNRSLEEFSELLNSGTPNLSGSQPAYPLLLIDRKLDSLKKWRDHMNVRRLLRNGMQVKDCWSNSQFPSEATPVGTPVFLLQVDSKVRLVGRGIIQECSQDFHDEVIARSSLSISDSHIDLLWTTILPANRGIDIEELSEQNHSDNWRRKKHPSYTINHDELVQLERLWSERSNS
jgi:hypothetical protein